jgi:predicted transcriptional regulator
MKNLLIEDRIRERMEELEYSPRDVAKIVGEEKFHYSVWRIVNKKTDPRLSTLRKIIKALNLDIII